MHVSSGQFKADVLQGRDSVRAREHECMHRTDRPPCLDVTQNKHSNTQEPTKRANQQTASRRQMQDVVADAHLDVV